MDRIKPPVTTDSTRDVVSNLHDGLLLLLQHRELDLPDEETRALVARLRREQAGGSYGETTTKVVAMVQERHGLASSGTVDKETAAVLNERLQEAGAFEGEVVEHAPTASARVLSGTVLRAEGVPAADLTLRLYQREFAGRSTLLEETVTDESGGYRLGYDPGARGRSVEVRALAADGTEVVLSEPLDGVSARSSARVDLVAPAGMLADAGEYRRLVEDLTPFVGEAAALAEASEERGRRDLTGLATGTGWDARLMALAASAQRVGRASGLDAEGLYGLFRAGLPTDAEALAQVSPATVRTALDRLRERGIVDLSDSAVKEFASGFARFADATRMTAKVPGSAGTYGELMDAAVDEDTKTRFARAFFAQSDRGRDGDDLWEAARAEGVDEPAIARLQWQGKLAYLAGNSAALTGALMDKLGDGDELRSPVALVEEGFYRAEAWSEQVRSLDGVLADVIPADYDGEDVDARLSAYAEDMARKVRLTYPTQVVTRMIDAGDIPLGDSAPVTVKLLDAAGGEGFELGRDSITAHLAKAPGLVADLGDDADEAVETVKTLHRVYQITPGNEAMTVLLELGLTSAYDVTALSYDAFVKVFEATYLDKFGIRPTGPQTRLVWRKAHQVAAMSYNLFGVVKKVDSDPELLAISGGAAARTAELNQLKGALRDYPTMESLFGSMDYCECAHCRSVLSPAAYLVDLLGFAEGEDAAWATFLADWEERTGTPYTDDFRNPYDALVARRPDLPQLQLDCANTNTELPYIDVVNEILEYHVAHGSLGPDAVHDTGDAESADLMAEPVHVITEAYRAVREAAYPIGLPFDLWTETVRRFGDHAGVPLAQLLDTFRPTEELVDAAAAYDRAAVFAEQLGLTSSELGVLTDPDPLAAWWKLYGYPSEAAATTAATDPDTGQRLDLNSAKALARRLDVTYQELVDLVQTAFVNPGMARQPLLVKLPAAMSTVRWFLDDDNQDFLDANDDLLGEVLSPSQRTRKDALSAEDWTRLTDLAALAARIDRYATAYGVTSDQVRAQLAAVPQDEVLVLADPDSGSSFDLTVLRYADGTAADPSVFVRLSWFVRLWRALGWSITELDTALAVFTPTDADGGLVLADRPLRTAVVYLAHLVDLADRLGLPTGARARLLTLWGAIPTAGQRSPYAAMFLTRKVAGADPIFEHPFGDYLEPAWVAARGAGQPPDFGLVKGHLPAIQGALGLTSAQVAAVLADAGSSVDAAELTMANVSTLARYAVLAKALRMSVPDLVGLRALTGLDPFRALAVGPLNDLAEDHPYSQTWAFVEIAQTLADTGVRVADLERLLRGRPDPSGAGRTDPRADGVALVGLADQLRQLRAEGEVPTDPATLTEQWLSEVLGQSAAPAVVERCLTMLRGAEPLSQATRDFFDTELLRRDGGAGTTIGFLDAADYPGLFEPEPDADESARRRTRVAGAFSAARYETLAAELVVGTLARHLEADAALVAALLTEPRLIASGETALLRQFVALADAGLDGDYFASNDATGARQATPRLVTEASTDARPVTDPPLPAPNSMRVAGHLVVDRTGPYRFTVELATAGAGARISFPHLPDPVLVSGVAGAVGAVLGTAADEFVQLEAGVPYEIEALATSLAGGPARVRVHGATAPHEPLSTLRLYPRTALRAATSSLALLRSATSLLAMVGLDLPETRHVLGHPAEFGGLVLGDLPTRPDGATPAELAAARVRFAAVLRLVRYTGLRSRLGVTGAELVEVFETASGPGDPWPAVRDLLATMLRRTGQEIAAAAAVLWPAGVRVVSDVPLQRLWDVLALAARFGTTADRLRDWSRVVDLSRAEAARAALATDVRETVKASYDDATWTSAVKPVSDALRAQRRDALVAFVLHTEALDRVEQLYELILLDPLTEPVVTTSRIRAALGSVQLFITRVLLNLEPEVHPSAIVNAGQWEWMKRYRVWEANRKIWLYPENWLEPEFRSDKSHLFVELEGKLLANDVSPEVVEDAFLDYLRGLEELARLDIVAMHLQDDVDFTRNTLHVVGRTFAVPHQYHYRRYANRLWSAWEPVDVAIEGDHVMPVVWRDRLYLFWLTFVEQAAAAGAAPVDVSEPVPLPTLSRTVEVHLHWSELVDGSWSAPKSAGYDLPADRRLTEVVPAGFTTSSVPVWVSVVPDPPVGAETTTSIASAGVYLNIGAPFNRSFHLSSRNSAPVPAGNRARPGTPFVVGTDASKVRATRYVGTSGKLAVSLRTRMSSEPAPDLPVTLDVLGSTGQFELLPVNNLITLGVSAGAYEGADDPGAVEVALSASIGEIENLMKPAFIADRNVTMFIEPEVTERTIEEWQEWVTTTPVPGDSSPPWIEDDRWWYELVKPRYPKPTIPGPGGGWTDPIDEILTTGLPHSRVKDLVGQDWITSAGTGLVFDGQVIGEAGAIDATLVHVAETTVDMADVTLPVAAGSGLATDQVLVVPSSSHLAGLGSERLGAGVVLVGSAGLNSTVHGVSGMAAGLPTSAGIFGAMP